MKDVTACVKTFMRDDYLFDCVKSLRTTYPDTPIFVADDGDTSDEKESKLREMGVSKYLRLPYGVGVCAGRNALADACETQYLLIGDDDFLYTPDTHLENLRTLMGVADIAAGGVLVNGEVLRYEDDFIIRNGRYDLGPVKFPPFETFNGVRYGKCDLTLLFFVARTDVVRRVRFDVDLKPCYEHEDFFMVAKKYNTRVVYCPDTLVLHKPQGYALSTEYLSHRWDHRPCTRAFFKKWGFTWGTHPDVENL